MDSAGHGPIGPSNPRAISCLEGRANRRRSARPSWWCPPPTQIPPEGVSESWDPPVLGAFQFGGAHESSTFCAPLPVVLLCRFPSLPPSLFVAPLARTAVVSDSLVALHQRGSLDAQGVLWPAWNCATAPARRRLPDALMRVGLELCRQQPRAGAGSNASF